MTGKMMAGKMMAGKMTAFRMTRRKRKRKQTNWTKRMNWKTTMQKSMAVDLGVVKHRRKRHAACPPVKLQQQRLSGMFGRKTSQRTLTRA